MKKLWLVLALSTLSMPPPAPAATGAGRRGNRDGRPRVYDMFRTDTCDAGRGDRYGGNR